MEEQQTYLWLLYGFHLPKFYFSLKPVLTVFQILISINLMSRRFPDVVAVTLNFNSKLAEITFKSNLIIHQI